MAMALIMMRTPWLFCSVLALMYFCDARKLPYPELKSILVLNDTTFTHENQTFKKLLVVLQGKNIASDFEIKLTKSDRQCLDDVRIVTENVWNNPPTARFAVIFPDDNGHNLYYLCVRRRTLTSSSNFGEIMNWHHAGTNIFIKSIPRISNDVPATFFYRSLYHSKIEGGLDRRKRSVNNSLSLENWTASSVGVALRVTGLRVEHSDKEPQLSESGVPVLLAESDSMLRLFGQGFTEDLVVTFTHEHGSFRDACQMTATQFFHVEKEGLLSTTVRIRVRLPASSERNNPFYMCAKLQPNSSRSSTSVNKAIPFEHQGAEIWLQLLSYQKILPIWASIIIIITCLSFSALFSGLNLGLMSLDRTELKILCNTGNESERRHARVIQPVRDHGNYLLCSILLGNVLVNSIFTILLDDLTSGLIAVVFSTLAIVMFGEISPQAVCSRHGLAVGARTILITKAVMLITFPLSYPISKVLDVILGEEIGNVYNRERLKELVKVTTDINDLDRDEVNIISGALELRKKNVSEVMTRIEDVFMLDYEAILDFETVSEIMKSGFSRIPVYEGSRDNIVTVLYIKDLAFVDPDDNTPLKTLCQFYQNPCNFVFEDLTLDVMFRQFKEGNKGHMAFVHRVNNEGEGDPFYETIGLVTLEDVIEELIQAEIMDETDVFTDNRSKRRRTADRTKQDFSVFAERRDNQRLHISPQLTLATYQYLSTSVDLFKVELISETTLRRLLKQDIYCHIKKSKERKENNVYIYQQGKAVDYFVLILEGRVEVTVGKENLVFDGGPFTYFGLQALMQNVAVVESPVTASNTNMGSLQSLNMDAMIKYTFQPDYSVRVVTDVLYVRVRRGLYMAAKRATLMERSQKDTNPSTEHFDDEMEKLLYSLDDDDGTSMDRMSPNKQHDREHKMNEATTPVPLRSSQSKMTSAGTSPASFSPREGAPVSSTSFSTQDCTAINGIAKFSGKQGNVDGEEGACLLAEQCASDTDKS